jgi:hypothetical protein
MLQVSGPNVSSVVFRRMLQVCLSGCCMFHTYVVSVLSVYCVCLQWFSSVFRCFFASVLEACFKCFICLQTYVATVASRCFKSRLDVCTCCLQLLEGARGVRRSTVARWGRSGASMPRGVGLGAYAGWRKGRVQTRASVRLDVRELALPQKLMGIGVGATQASSINSQVATIDDSMRVKTTVTFAAKAKLRRSNSMVAKNLAPPFKMSDVRAAVCEHKVDMCPCGSNL